MTISNSYVWLTKTQFPILETVGFCILMFWMAMAFQQGTSMALKFPQWDGYAIQMPSSQPAIQTPGGSELFVP